MDRATSAKIRRIAVICIIAAVLVFFVCRLVGLQIINGAEYQAARVSVSEQTAPIPAARGEIVDRYGTPVVYNRQGYALVFDGAYFPSVKEQEERNKIILSLIELLESSGEEWNDILPLRLDSKGKVVFKEDCDDEIKHMKSSDMLDLNSYATAQNCFDDLVTRYSLASYSASDALKIASVCYSMKSISFGVSTPYTFAYDVSDKTVARVKENSGFYKGVECEVVPYREYADGTLAPHIIGRVAAINAEEYEKKKSEGYSIQDVIGKSGIEYAMESYLRGTAGKKAVYTDADGNRTDRVAVEPQQGSKVVLTIDNDLQKIVQNALEDCLLDYESTKGNMVPSAGAAVVIDCNTGEILACASYPSYDISTYAEKYKELAEATADPLWNRALLSTYATGSTMKPSVAIAALEEGIITKDSTVYCGGMYNYLGQKFKCEQNHRYANVNVVYAIKESCNTFFYETGKNVGITKMNEYRTLLGFGQKTGCELTEATGILDSPEYRESLGQEWLPGYTVQSAIGQAGNLISPIQLANYCATIANGGTRYRTRFVKSVLSSDNSTVIVADKPEIMCETGISKDTLDTVRQGMHLVCAAGDGYCHRFFTKLDPSIDPAAKTGTSQEWRNIDGESVKINNGFLITYAPYENPQIAMALVGEGMISGVYVAPIAAAVYDYYFSNGEYTDSTTAENMLVD